MHVNTGKKEECNASVAIALVETASEFPGAVVKKKIGWLQTREIYCPAILETRSLTSRCQQGPAPSEAQGRVLCSSGSCRQLLVPGASRLGAASLPLLPHVCPLPPRAFASSSFEDSDHAGLRTPSPQCDLTLTVCVCNDPISSRSHIGG